jgi:hypothetical protein
MPDTLEAAPAADVSSAPDSGASDSGVTFDSLFDQAPNEQPEAAEPQAATEALTEEQPAPVAEDEDIEPQIDPNAKEVTLRKGRWDNVYQGHKFAKAVQEFAPTVEAARAHYEAATDLRRMVSDFQSADPRNIDNFIGYLGQQSPEGITTLADRLPEYLKASAPEVYEGMQSKILSEIVENNYAAAAQSKDPQDLYMAQIFEYSQTRKYRQAGELKAPDPLAEREAKIAQQEQQLEHRQKQEQQAVVKQWTDGTYASIKTNIDAETDAVLGPAKASFTAPVLAMLKNQIRQEVVNRIAADPEFSANFNIDFKKAMYTARNDQARQQLSDLYLSRVRPIIKAVAKPLVTSATKTVVDQNQQVHARAQQSQAKTAAGGGRPVPRTANPAVRPGMSLSEQLDAVFAST